MTRRGRRRGRGGDDIWRDIEPGDYLVLWGILAGNPGANEAKYRIAGVDRFIFMKCDVLGTLHELLRAEGVMP
jgi:hypothetical protein